MILCGLRDLSENSSKVTARVPRAAENRTAKQNRPDDTSEATSAAQTARVTSDPTLDILQRRGGEKPELRQIQ